MALRSWKRWLAEHQLWRFEWAEFLKLRLTGRAPSFVHAGDGAALIEAITKLRNSPQLRDRLGSLAMKRRTIAMQRVRSPTHSRSFIESAFRRVRTHSANNQLLRREGAGAIWFCDRLPCRGQVHGPGHAGEHEALLSRCANLPDGRWRF